MEAKELFTLLANTADATYAVDDKGLICFWNRAAEELFGYSSSEALNKHCWEVFQGRNPLGAPVCKEHCQVRQLAAKRSQIPHFDLEVAAASGQRVGVDVSILVVRDEHTGRRYIVHMTRGVQLLGGQVLEAAKQLVEMSRAPAPQSAIRLTEQEQKVLRLVAQGKRPKEIASELQMNLESCRSHLQKINRKLGTRNRLEAVIHATREGLL